MKKLAKVLILAVVLIMIFGTVFSSAAEPYDTYTYSIDGEPLKSPPAFSAIDDFDAVDMGIVKLDPEKGGFSNKVTDIVTDNEGNVYISDTYNDRIVVLNKYYEAVHIISAYTNEIGQKLTLNDPKGMFVTDPDISADKSSYIYVCNTGVDINGNDVGEVVIFDRDFNYVRTIRKPESKILGESAFKPDAVAVDKYGRIFITSMSAYEGVIVLSADGEFTGFIGAQEVSTDLLDRIWRKFMSQEQLQLQELNLANPYNNITVDKDGFVYVTTSATEDDDLKNQLSAIRSKKATFSPVKKLNAQGTEIMKRNGFFDPGGEVVINYKDVSTIIDVAIGAENTWTILDTDAESGRFFTYDQSGNLLFAFGVKGDQLGQGADLAGMTYHVVTDTKTGEDVYRLVSMNKHGELTVYEPTDYYSAIMKAIHNEGINDYVQSRIDWENVLSLNNNFDLAYIGIGKALYHQGEYEEAMEYLESAYETEVWSKASGAAGKDFMQVWLFPIIILVIAVVVLFFKFLGYAKKVNKATSLKVGRKSYFEELLYAFHLVFHPFDGFWDLKHEKRGSVRAATTILAFTGISLFYESIGRGYPFNPRGESMNILLLFAILLVIFFLFCISNWCLTTLFEGEGSFKDIYIATAYSLAPLPLFIIISTILTNVLTIEAKGVISLITAIGYIWVGILIFFGMLVTHDYTMNKNFVTILGTIVAMLVIAFIVALFFSLVARMISFVIAIFTEIGNRM